MIDEKKINELYVENMGEAFDRARDNGNLEECRRIIETLKNEGFQNDADSLIDELYNTSIIKFAHPSNLYGFL